MFYQLYIQPAPLPEDALFRPLITKGCRTSLAETDYNLHKSNSTYFADFDVSRAMLLSCLMRRGFRGARKASREAGAGETQSHGLVQATTRAINAASDVVETETMLRTPHASGDVSPRTRAAPKNASDNSGRVIVALGSVACSFKRELAPNEEFEIWTRVLSWDHKWMYLVSHMVKAGTVQPDGYSLQSWKTSGRGGFFEKLFGIRRRAGRKPKSTGTNGVLKELEQEKKEEWQKGIFASSISKYVVKRGRRTVPPEVVWNRSSLLPPKPVNDEDHETSNPHAWTWANVERERQRGLGLAESFAALDGAIEEFPVCWSTEDEEVGVLGEFQDPLTF